ncbi:MAG: hypothetical protein IID48_01065 [Proteobacteria bacterium]|nr:hypothetical protein [Pseudomonadota bacterium]
MSYWFKRVLLGVGLAALLAPAAQANHQWSSYHWERDGVDPLTLSMGDNHSVFNSGDRTADWPSIFGDVVADWGRTETDGSGGYGGAHLDTVGTSGGSGNIESFNDDYGDNGWLGLASIWVSRGKNKHITRGEAKVNEYFITLAGYEGFNELNEWQQVMCQEIGHTFGLNHNREGDTGGTPDDTCMNDETRPLNYPWPNVHDTEMFDSATMYAHDHGGGGGGGKEKCHPKFGCAGAAVGHAVWAEQYADEEAMFDAADAVVDATVLSSNFDRMAGRGRGAVPVTRVVLRVEDTLSGATRRVIVLEQTRGPGLELADDPGYVTGDGYTLYLREIGNNTYRTVNPDGRIRN